MKTVDYIVDEFGALVQELCELLDTFERVDRVCLALAAVLFAGIVASLLASCAP